MVVLLGDTTTGTDSTVGVGVGGAGRIATATAAAATATTATTTAATVIVAAATAAATVIVAVIVKGNNIVSAGGINDTIYCSDDARRHIPQSREMQIIVHTYVDSVHWAGEDVY